MPQDCLPTNQSVNGWIFRSLNLQSNPNGDAQQTYGPLESSPFTWSTNITSGTTLVVTLKDSTGTTAQSGGFTIQSGCE